MSEGQCNLAWYSILRLHGVPNNKNCILSACITKLGSKFSPVAQSLQDVYLLRPLWELRQIATYDTSSDTLPLLKENHSVGCREQSVKYQGDARKENGRRDLKTKINKTRQTTWRRDTHEPYTTHDARQGCKKM